MNMASETNECADAVFDLWKTAGLDISEAASPDLIEKTEQQVSFTFPEAFRQLYKRADGWKDMAWNEHMFSMWPLERIIEEYDYGRHPHFIGFCDYLVNSHWIGFVRYKPGIFKRYDLEGFSEPEKIADSFEDAIEMINTNADAIY